MMATEGPAMPVNGNLFVLFVPYMICTLLIAKIPQASYKSLTYLRALQVYDAQPAPTKDRAIVRARPATKVRKRGPVGNCSSTLILIVVLAFPFVIGLAFPLSALVEDGMRPALSYMRDAVPATYLALLLTSTLHDLIASFCASVEWVHRDCNVEENKAMAFRSRFGRWPTLKNSTVIAKSVCFGSLLAAAASLQYSGNAAIVLGCGVGAVLALKRVSRPSEHNSSYRVHVLAVCLIFGIFLAFAALLVVIVMVTIHFAKTEDQNVERKSAPAKEEKLTGILKLLDDAMTAIMNDKAIGQCFDLLHVIGCSFTISFPAAVVSLAYRFDVHCTDTELVKPSEEESQAILHSSMELANQEQHYFKKPHPFDALGRYKIASGFAAVSKNQIAHLRKPMFKTALAALVVSEVACVLMHNFFIREDLFKQTFLFPTSRAEARAISDGGKRTFVGPLGLYAAYIVAYPVVLFAMAACAFYQGGFATMRQLWTYEEACKQEYTGVPSDADDNDNDHECEKADDQCKSIGGDVAPDKPFEDAPRSLADEATHMGKLV